MSSEVVNVEVGEYKKYPELPSPSETNVVSVNLQIGILARNQFYKRYGMVGLLVPEEGSSNTMVQQIWSAELMKYSYSHLRPFTGKDGSYLHIQPPDSEGVSQSLPPFLLRGNVNGYVTGAVMVSEEGFALSEADLRVPIGIERPLGKTLKRAMDAGKCTDLLAGHSYVWVGPQYAGKSLFRVGFGGDSGRDYRDAVIVGPSLDPDASKYNDGSPMNTIYAGMIVQIRES